VEKILQLEARVHESYAHNSFLYEYLDKQAGLETITEFLAWDAEQPPFHLYLRHWLTKVPNFLLKPLTEHIEIEESEAHSALFKEMLDHLLTKHPCTLPLKANEVLSKLNYTFSEECANETDYGFFIGGFLATEIMSAKRCRQIYNGLKRHGVIENKLKYLTLHIESDAQHQVEAREFAAMAIAEDSNIFNSLRRGVEDRLERSSAYLKWYEQRIAR
jgi:hypothetical protein